MERVLARSAPLERARFSLSRSLNLWRSLLLLFLTFEAVPSGWPLVFVCLHILRIRGRFPSCLSKRSLLH
jgi:hypothetical protein